MGFNKVTWRGAVIVKYDAERRPGTGDTLWRDGDPLVLPMQKRNCQWDRSAPLADLEKQGWRGKC